jgi:LysR family transcriptional regulator, low CO2-responsive transcriptional regulator
MLRVASSSLFAEHAAPGLIQLFSDRARDLDVELSTHSQSRFETLLQTRAVDAAIGSRPTSLDPSIIGTHFLNYQMVAVASPDHPLARRAAAANDLRRQTWLLGPSAAGEGGEVPAMLQRLNVPEEQRQIFQSHAAALEEAKRGKGIALAVSFAVSQDVSNGDLTRLSGPHLQAQGGWSILTLADRNAPPVAEELTRFVTTPRAIQAMLRGSGVAAGRFRPSIHVTLWS